MAWVFVVIGGIMEVGFTTCMRYVDGFKNLPWTLAFLVCVLTSFFSLQYATKTIPLGTAYAVWTGIGAVGTVIIGMIWYHEPATWVRGTLIAVLIGSLIGLKLTAAH